MSIGTLDALSAYGRVGSAGGLGKSSALSQPQGSEGFGTMVEKLVTDTAGSLKTAEHAASLQVAGKGDLIDVVTAMGAAETALDTMVAVRDKVVNAYSDIMRMQI